MGLGSSNLGAAHGYGRKAWEDSGLRARHRGNMTELGDTHDAYFLRRRPRGAAVPRYFSRRRPTPDVSSEMPEGRSEGGGTRENVNVVLFSAELKIVGSNGS